MYSIGLKIILAQESKYKLQSYTDPMRFILLHPRPKLFYLIGVV